MAEGGSEDFEIKKRKKNAGSEDVDWGLMSDEERKKYIEFMSEEFMSEEEQHKYFAETTKRLGFMSGEERKKYLDEIEKKLDTQMVEIDKQMVEIAFPNEILRMDGESIEKYKQALAEGCEAVHIIRVMVIGHFNVGKTTLTKRLLGNTYDTISQDSTDGIDVYCKRCKVELNSGQWTSMTEENKSEDTSVRLQKVLTDFRKKSDAKEHQKSAGIDAEKLDNPEKDFDPEKLNILVEDLQNNGISRLLAVKQKRDYADLSIWDFAGQYAFYTTHQVFFTPRAVYLLVTDMSKHTDDVVKGDECYFDCSGLATCKVSEFINLWLNSVHGYCPSDKPSVILVGTHADKLDQTKRDGLSENYFEAIRNLLSDKQTRCHLVEEEFAVDNTTDDPALDGLKKKILEVASQQDYWGELIPAKWITLEKALDELRDKGEKVIKRADVEVANKNLPVPLGTAEDLQLFLRYHHELGNIIYFSGEGLGEHVLLQPQWLIDAFKSFITSKAFAYKKTDLIRIWQEFNGRAVLNWRLIDAVWKKDGNESFYENRHYLIALMEKLDIIAKPRSFCEDTSNTVVEEAYFYVPSVLKDKPPPKYLTPSAVFKSTSVLCFTDDATKFVHPALFNRLIAASISKWPIDMDKTKNLIFCGCGIFRVNDTHRLTMYFLENVIQIWMTKYGQQDPNPDASVCSDVREFVEQNLQRITKLFSKSNKIETFVKCPDVTEVGSGLVPLSKILTTKEFLCNSQDTPHVHTSVNMLRFWFREDMASQEGVYGGLPDEILDRTPTDKEIASIAPKIGKEYQQLLLLLGLRKAEIEQSRIDNPSYMVDQTRNMLMKWRDKSESATFRELATAMRSVDIDTFDVFKDMK